MARKVTKEKNGGKEFLQTLKELAYEKGIDEEQAHPLDADGHYYR